MIEAALTYAKHGYKVFPVQPKGKAPVTQLVPHGHKEATTDLQKIRDWWGVVKEANIGMPMRQNGFLCFDLDPRNGFTNESWGTDQDMSSIGRWQITGSGGWHVLFTHPGEEYKFSKTAGEGIDIRDDGYIVVWPSVHPSGGTYLWDRSRNNLTDVPDWLLQKVIKTHTFEPTEWMEMLQTIPKGKQHKSLVSIAGTIRRCGYGEPEIEAFLLACNYRLEEPAPPENLKAIAQSICTLYPIEKQAWESWESDNKGSFVTDDPKVSQRKSKSFAKSVTTVTPVTNFDILYDRSE